MVIFLILLLFLSNFAYATVPVKNAYTNVSVNVCTPLDTSANCTIGSGGVSGYWTASGNNIYNNNSSNVGIGSANPGTLLDVNGTLRATAFSMSAGSSPQILYNNSGTISGVSNSGVDSNGNIGIGTTSTISKINVFDTTSDVGMDINGNVTSGGIDSFTKLMLHFDGTNGSTNFVDSSISPHTMTAVNSAAISTAQNIFGGASGIFSKTTSDSVTTPDAAELNLGANDFSIAFRVYFNSISTTQTMISQYGAAGNRGWLFFANSSALTFDYSTDGTSVTAKSVSWVPSINTWYAIEIDRSGNNLYFFIDGSQVGTTQDVTGVSIFNSSNVLRIGGDGAAGTGDPLDAYMDELRYDVGIARHTSNYTVPASPFSQNVNQPRVRFKDNGTTTWSITSDGANSDGLTFSNGVVGTNDRMTLTTAGNLGLGVTAPVNKLDVSGSEAIGSSYSGTYTAPTNGLIVQGNVGIGTKTPGGGLVVMNGNIGIGTWLPVFPIDFKGGTVNIVGQLNAAKFVDVNNGSYYVDPSADSGFSAALAGNVGIGSTAPGALLDVAGLARTRALAPQEETFASSTSITPTGLYKFCYMANTQGAGTFTVNNPTNNGVEGQTLILKISSTAVQTFSWGTNYNGGSYGLPTATLGTSTIEYFSFIWDAVNSHWDYQGGGGNGFN